MAEYGLWWDTDNEIQKKKFERWRYILKLEYYRNKRYEIWNELQMIKYRTWAMNDEILKVTRYELSNW